jgi:hypothetical protein
VSPLKYELGFYIPEDGIPLLTSFKYKCMLILVPHKSNVSSQIPFCIELNTYI